MWKFLYKLASPKGFYEYSGKWLPWFSALACLLLPAAFIWGLFIAPADYQQGDAYRIMFVHVPSAFLSLSLYAWMGFLAVLLLVWRIKLAGLLLTQIAPVGAGMAALALVTGSIWGRPMWGSWWVWDARLTSELILLLIYVVIIVAYQSLRQRDEADRMIAVLTLVGLIDLPIIHYSVYWWNTLHQGATLTLFAKPKIALAMLYPLLLALLGFLSYCLWIITQKARCELLQREKRQRWVRAVIMGEGE